MIKPEDFDGKISIITAVYNGADCIHHLIDSLRQQTDQNFEWVVVDGLSTDNTLEILKQINDLNIKIISEADFGIYDALNKGIKSCSGEYYLVAGADDILYPNAIQDYKNAIKEDIGIITAYVHKNGKIQKSKKGSSWIYAQSAYISSHAIGTLIKKELHKKYGFYSNKLPIAADQLFIKTCCQSNVTLKEINILVGKFSTEGVSSIDTIGTCTEIFRVQLMTENYKILLLFWFILKLLKRAIKL